jgi:hypothetical protein
MLVRNASKFGSRREQTGMPPLMMWPVAVVNRNNPLVIELLRNRGFTE